MSRKVLRPPFLRQLPVTHQLGGVLKAAANKTIRYFSIYDRNGTSAWPAPLLNDNYEEEYAFVGMHCSKLGSPLVSHVHEANEWH